MTQAPAPLRLRHVCLMAPRLEPAVQSLRAAFGLEVGYRDPLVAQWGIENAVLPVGADFLEVCAPVEADSAAARFLARRPEGGAYILVMECQDVARRRARLDGLGTRVVTDLSIPGFRTVQMHPQDTGACMLEFNQTDGGGAARGPYTPAGPCWQQAVREDHVARLAAVEVRAPAPERLAVHWSQITETAVTRAPNAMAQLALGAELRFGATEDDSGARVAAIELSSPDPADTLARARAAGLPEGRTEGSLRLLGLDFRLVPLA